jgi:hypothetical protein
VKKLSNNQVINGTRKLLTFLPPLEIKAKGRGRVYVDDRGNEFPSVTTILNVINKPALIPWAKKQSLEKVKYVLQNHVMNGTLPEIKSTDDIDAIINEASKTPDKALQLAGDFGSHAHALIEKVINARIHNDKEPVITADFKVVMESFEMFCEQYNPVFVGSEVQVCYRPAYTKIRYAGTVDAVIVHEDNPIVVDFKTSKGIYDEHRLQVGAYSNALQTLNKKHLNLTGKESPFDMAWVVKLGKEKANVVVDKFITLPSYRAFSNTTRLYYDLREKEWLEKNLYL